MASFSRALSFARPKRFRFTFLWRFTLTLLAGAIFAASALTYAIEASHRRALESDLTVAAIGRVDADLTSPLDRLGREGTMTPQIRAAIESAAKTALLSESINAVHIYRPDGTALYPADGRPQLRAVHDAIASDGFVSMDRDGVRRVYAPFFSTSEHVYVVAVDMLLAQLDIGFERERTQVFAIVGGVLLIIFASLVTLAAGASRELERRRRVSRTNFLQTLHVMADTIDLRDPYTAGHSRRVASYSRSLATALRMPQALVESIENAALLHDIGKIAIPDAVLFKPGPLDERERAIICTHPTIGARMLEGCDEMDEIVPCVLHHHERIDGTGYPQRISGDDIPVGARVIAVADTFDAMTTDRPYRRGLDVPTTIAEMRRVSGKQLEAAFVEAFIELLEHGTIALLDVPHPSESPVAFGRKLELEPAS